MTRPRDGFFSRNLTVGGTSTFDGGGYVPNTTSLAFQCISPFQASTASIYGTYCSIGNGVGLGFSSAGTPIAKLGSGAGTVSFELNGTSAIGANGGYNCKLIGGSIDFAVGTFLSHTTGLSLSSVGLYGAGNTLKIVNSTNAQTFDLFNTYTSATSLEAFRIKAVAAAAYQIGSAIGSAGGTNRAIEIGHYNSGGTFTSALSIATTGDATFAKSITVTKGAGAYTSTFNSGSSSDNYNQFVGSSGSLVAEYGLYAGYLYFQSLTGLSGTRFYSNNTISAQFTSAGVTLSQGVATSGSPTTLTVTGAAHTTLTLSTEATDVNFNLSRTVQFATGALTTQRAMRIQAPTYSFVGASTITTASTLSISGPPVAGTNATISTAFSLYSEGGLVGSVGDVVVTTAAGAFGVRSGAGGSNRIQMKGGSGLEMAAACYVAWGPNSTNVNSLDVYIYRDAAGTLALRNAANVQSLGVYGTWTSTTSYERLNVRGKASANFEIGPENGSAGGTLRGLTLGGYTAGSATITPWLTFTNAGVATFAGAITASNLSGTNTGDQDLSSYATTAAVAAGYVALTGTQTVAGVKTFTSSLTYSADGAALSQTYKCYNPSTANGTQFLCQRARGSAASPLYPASGDVLLGHYAYGWDENLAGFSLQAHYICSASAAWTTTPDISQGTQWTWGTTDPLDVATVNTNRMRLHGDGSLTLGSIASTGGLFQLVGTNAAATGLGTAKNRLRFTDIDTSVLADQPIGEIEFYSADASPTTAGARACFGAYTESTALATAFVWGLGASNATPSEVMRLTSTGRLGLGTAPGGGAVSAFLHVISTSLQMRVGYDVSNYYTTTVSSAGAITFEAVGASAGFTFSDPVTLSSTSTATGLLTATVGIKTTKTIYQTTETTSTPTGAVTINLTLNNHQTLALTSVTTSAQVTFTPPTGSCAGTLIVKQHAATPKDITTWAVTGGTIKWMATEPDWVNDIEASLRVVSWRWNGSIMCLVSTESAA